MHFLHGIPTALVRFPSPCMEIHDLYSCLMRQCIPLKSYSLFQSISVSVWMDIGLGLPLLTGPNYIFLLGHKLLTNVDRYQWYHDGQQTYLVIINLPSGTLPSKIFENFTDNFQSDHPIQPLEPTWVKINRSNTQDGVRHGLVGSPAQMRVRDLILPVSPPRK